MVAVAVTGAAGGAPETVGVPILEMLAAINALYEVLESPTEIGMDDSLGATPPASKNPAA